MKIGKDSRFVMTGDSVTDVGRERPLAEGTLFDRLGRGYPQLVSGWLNALYADLNINVINTGVSGNTSRDLRNRWEAEILSLSPDWLSVMIGINDVWRQFDSPNSVTPPVLPDEFESNYEWMLEKAKPIVTGKIILLTPFFLEPNRADQMRARCDEYGLIVKKLAAKHDLICVDTQAYFERILKQRHAGFLSWDRVHPNCVGHTLLAQAVLRSVGCDFSL